MTQKWIVGSLFVGGLIFAFSPGPMRLINNPVNWEMREQLVYLTGVCAMSLMVSSMILSARFELVNKIAGGLDKAYVIHKWTGIYSFVFVLLHWLTEKVPHWLVELNIIPNPGELVDGSQFSELEIALFQSGVLIAEVLFYGFVLLVTIALFNKIPYRYFRITHKIFPGIFLLLAYHAATAPLKEHWFISPGAYLLLVLLTIGSFAAIIGLFQQIGKSRKINAVIKDIEYHKRGILDIRLRTLDKPFIHQAGQYAFVQFAHDKEPHPFTIASSGVDPNTLRFSIKSLGDFTKDLNNSIGVGQNVKIEGPYGEFKFEDDCKRQVWIAGGIGITPFMARLEYLSNHGGVKKPVDFWYCTRGDLESQFPSSLQSLCEKNAINFSHLNSNEKEYLSIDLLKTKIGDFNTVSIWFCGPNDFAKFIIKGLKSSGFDMRNFHYDSFSMR